MRNFFKKGITFALAFTLVVTMCFGSTGTAKVYAAEEPTALYVYDGDKLVKEYTLNDLKAIAKAEGDIKYKFSGYNRNPSFAIYLDETGPTLEAILAGAQIDLADNDLIKFVATDQADATFVANELFRDRYFYPNGSNGTANGMKAPVESYADAEKTPTILAFEIDENWTDLTLRFGQIAPNEQNRATSMQSMNGGKIIIRSGEAETWVPIVTANYSSGEILPETELFFELPESLKNKKVQVYFTNDGSEPGFGDAIYNYDKWGSLQNIVLPEDEGTVTYTFKVIGYGKLDSEVTAFTYEVKDVAQPAVPTGLTAKPSTDNHSVVLEWTAAADADGYEVLRYSAETEKFEVLISISGNDSNSLQDGTAEFGVEQRYKVRSFKQLSSGQKVYSSATPEQKATLPIEDAQPVVPDEPADKPEPPTVAKATLNSVAKTGYGGILVKWKKVAGADGYEILRTDAKGNKFTKTIKNVNTLSWKNTGLKTGRKYTYKVRAYVNFDGKKVYGKYSGVKSATPALNKPVISKLTPASRAITVKWKQVPGANGYKIYRSTTGKAGSFKVVKTINKGGTLSWKNTKLKKGKRYYYKVKAYRIVDKKYVYSSISSVKYIKSK